MRDELAKFLSEATCDVCEGVRLNPIARNVLIDGVGLGKVTNLSIADCEAYYRDLKLPGARGEVATKIIKEILA